MVTAGEIARRARGRVTGRLESLPILALSVHSACNCRCVMCDIWKANADRREISSDDLSRHVDAIRRLHVQRVMLTGGEPLLHRNLWALCAQLRALPARPSPTKPDEARRSLGEVGAKSGRSRGEGGRIRLTLVTTGLLIDNHAADIATSVDTVVISLDGPRDIHDAIRRVKGGFDRIAKGVLALRAQHPAPRLIARCVVQRENAAAIPETIESADRMGFDEMSFLAADVSSAAFNRPEPWPAARVSEVAVPPGEVDALAISIDRATSANPELFENGFVSGGRPSLDRILQYYRALAGDGPFPDVQCNAPWISAVLEPDGTLRPCFFHPAYGSAAAGLEQALNSESALAFRRSLDVARDDTCRRCVCSLKLPLGRNA